MFRHIGVCYWFETASVAIGKLMRTYTCFNWNVLKFSKFVACVGYQVDNNMRIREFLLHANSLWFRTIIDWCFFFLPKYYISGNWKLKKKQKTKMNNSIFQSFHIVVCHNSYNIVFFFLFLFFRFSLLTVYLIRNCWLRSNDGSAAKSD